MTPERFRALTEAYGADPKRWPAAEREAAKRLTAEGAPEVVRALAEAGRLDRLLSAHGVAPASAELARRIEASAPKRGIGPRSRPAFWWSGAGLASAGLAGALAGALLVAHLSPLMVSSVLSDLSYSATVFGDIDDQDD